MSEDTRWRVRLCYGKTPICVFFLFWDRFFFFKKKTGCGSAQFFCVKVFEWFVLCDSGAKSNTALGACCRCQAEVFHESTESTCCNRRHSNSCKPSASFLPTSVGAKRHLVNTRPRTPVAEAALPKIESCLRARGFGCQIPRWQLPLRLPDTQSPRLPQLPLANRRRLGRQDRTTTSAALWRIWSDVGIHCVQKGRLGTSSSWTCASGLRLWTSL